MFSAGGSSDHLPINQQMSASQWLALIWTWNFCNNCRKILILRNCRIPYYVILPPHCHQVFNLELSAASKLCSESGNNWLTNSECWVNIVIWFWKYFSQNKVSSNPILHPLHFQIINWLTDSELLKYFYLCRLIFSLLLKIFFMELYLILK